MLLIPAASAQHNTSAVDTSDYLPFPEGLNTNLMIAAAKGYPSEIHRLIKLGAEIDATDYENISALIYAVANNKLTTVKALLEYNPDTEMFTNSGESALHIAAKDNMPEIAEALIRAETDINLRDRHGATPLHYASAYGYLYMCDLLLYYGADIEARSDDGSTALISAVWSGQAPISDLLLQSGADPNVPDNEGYTPFIIAGQNNDTLLMSLLLDKGANPFAINEYMYDALGMAIRNDHYEAFRYMVDKTDPEWYKKTETASPVLVARKYGRSRMLQELKDAGFTEPAKLNFDHVKIQAGIKTALRDYYTGMTISLKDPLLKIMINAGFEMKPGYSRVLVQSGDTSFYQYYDRRYIIYGGLGKEFKLMENYSGETLSLDINLNAGYMMTEKYRGTEIKPPEMIKLMPRAVLRWSRDNFNIYAGYEYMKTELYRIGPHWLSFGVSYDIYFDKLRSPVKKIKWY
ncbi:MAG: ankyrin repeat domain-containing protein [Bacteroidales bacterium]|nr:ankyrin repeat domain-containing protein [Bacteroidales bacterium]